MIPTLRGPFRSREFKSLLQEAEGLIDRGVKEINLIAQDTTMYGRDLEGKPGLEDLLEELLGLPGIGWIRILYSHPRGISDRLLELLDEENAICSYLDLPLQHVNEHLLKDMGRGAAPNPRRLIDRIRSRTRHVSLRTTMMIGFPGETDEMFQELYHFVKTASFDHLGAFIYSRERGTPAARMNDLIEPRVAEKRLDALMQLQTEISLKKNRNMVGKVVPVLNEGVNPETDLLLVGRTQSMAPDVDGHVIINKGKGTVGEILRVQINEAHTYDLVGEIV